MFLRILFVLTFCCLALEATKPSHCRSCALVRCAKPVCKGGTTPGRCGCCQVCLKQLGEKCGGKKKTLGTCEKPLVCKGKYGHGVCSCPSLSLCSRIICKYGQMKTRLPNGCEWCKCRPKPACPTSNCLYIKCGNGVITTTDQNGCKSCKCKPCIKVACKCPYGTIWFTDKHGCRKCTCKPKPVCLKVACRCTYGTIWYTDKHGCRKCKCKPKPICLKVACRCTYGTIWYTDKHGCRKCKCKPKPKFCLYKGKKFKIGSARYQQCNKCTCTVRGVWRCTRKGCRTGVCYLNGKAIKNGQTFFDGCNNCRCSVRKAALYGSISCSRRYCGACRKIICTKPCPYGFYRNKRGCAKTCACKPKPKPKFCVYNKRRYPIGSSIYQQCNKCRCGSSGLWNCTKKGCRKGVCYYKGKAVRKGKRFFDGCNWCTCYVRKGASYGSFRCTRRFCGSCRKIFCTNHCRNGYVRNKRGCAKSCKCRPGHPYTHTN